MKKREEISVFEEQRKALSLGAWLAAKPVIAVSKGKRTVCIGDISRLRDDREIPELLEGIAEEIRVRSLVEDCPIYNIFYFPPLDHKGDNTDHDSPPRIFAVGRTNASFMLKKAGEFFNSKFKQYANFTAKDALPLCFPEGTEISPKLKNPGFNVTIPRLTGEFGKSTETNREWELRTQKIAVMIRDVLPGGHTGIAKSTFRNGRIVFNTDDRDSEAYKLLHDFC